jgi:hydrogenase nickel incorporation protein HypB
MQSAREIIHAEGHILLAPPDFSTSILPYASALSSTGTPRDRLPFPAAIQGVAMCTTCGCEDHAHAPHSHGDTGSRLRRVSLERSLLEKNDAFAARNRQYFQEQGILALNLVSSPGSGKTSLLVATLQRLAGSRPVAVVEGDQQTSRDADRIRAAGAPAVQINTGKGCHLDAHGVEHAIQELAPAEGALVFIENVGNLVCPAPFDLGEAHKVVILSVTEGEDKPIKYPDMFAAADLMLLNKVDLLPHVEFDEAACLGFAKRVNPRLDVIRTSARSGEGLQAWIEWILARSAALAS